MPTEPRHVLSVQSHVVHGIVGNKAAVLPLQLRGFNVDPLNVCHLSNHTGYGVFAGTRITADEFKDVWQGLARIGATAKYTHVLTGYIGRAPVLEALVDALLELRAARPDLAIVCDPVCGDHGRLYVPEDVPPLYRKLLRISDVATPNGFEAEMLSGVAITDDVTAAAAVDWFHEQGVRLVVITSFHPCGSTDGSVLRAFASLRLSPDAAPVRAFADVPKLEGKFSGTGDLFSALVLSDWEALRGDAATLPHFLGSWCSLLHEVITRTRRVDPETFSELDLVGCRDALGRTNLSTAISGRLAEV
jgi:pyridoxine kinase